MEIDMKLSTVAVAWMSERGFCWKSDSRIFCHSGSETGHFLTINDPTRPCLTGGGSLISIVLFLTPACAMNAAHEQDKLTFDMVWSLALGPNQLEVQGIGSL